MRARVLCLLILCFAADVFAAKKDFKGLFGSYRRERFTENEGRSTDFGMDLMLSTLLPVSTVVTSSEGGGAASSLYYSSFFNAEASFFFTLSYNWEIFANVGYYTYSTRKQNGTTTSASVAGTPQYQLFDMEAIPAIVGLKYRFGTSDIVPYVGAGAGMAYVHRRTTYDYISTAYDDNYSSAIAAQATAGVQFYISPRVGIRLETSAMYLGLQARTFSPDGGLPALSYQANPIAVRYSSGLFVLF